MGRKGQWAAGLAAMMISVLAVTAAAEEPASSTLERSQSLEETFATYYGQGLRNYAEGDFDASLEDLFRAYGLRPSSQIMALIVEIYDTMGHCDAAVRQTRIFRRVHPEDEAEIPELERCSATAEIAIQCNQPGSRVWINGERRARCGQILTVPAGEEYHLSLADSPARQSVVVAEGGREFVELIASTDHSVSARVPRLPGWAAQVERLQILPVYVADVPRLGSVTSPYRVYQSQDGIYELWLRDESEERTSPSSPQVEILCPNDAPDGEEERGCSWLRELRRQSPHGEVGDSPFRYEIFIPRIP